MSGLHKEDDGFVTSGGRVILAVGKGETIEEAQKQLIKCRKIKSDNLFYRNDIGNKALK